MIKNQIISLLFLGFSFFFFRYASTLPVGHEPIFVVIIDAGSSGSRAIQFSFHRSDDGSTFILDEEVSVKNNEGLATFADNPSKGAESIDELVNKVKTAIPLDKWKSTLLTLEGTAGLRILAHPQAEKLLKEVNLHLSKQPFDLEPARIINGTDEGIEGWISLVYLTNLVQQTNDEKLAAIDLGGASMQVTLPIHNPAVGYSQTIVYPISKTGNPVTLWIQSYLHFGLSAAQDQILTIPQNFLNATDLVSVCVNPCIKTAEYSYNQNSYIVHGLADEVDCARNTIEVFEKCEGLVEQLVSGLIPEPPAELKQKNVYAINGFYWVAHDAGLLNTTKEINVLQVKDFTNAAKKECSVAHQAVPFECLRLIYASTVLSEGFQLDPDTEIRIVSPNLQGHAVTWALGAALRLLEKKYLQ